MKIAKVTGGFSKVGGSNFFRLKERNVLTSSITGFTVPQTATPDMEGKRIFVNATGNVIKVIDYNTFSVLSTISIGSTSYGVTVDKNAGRILVSNVTNKQLKIYDYTTLASVSSPAFSQPLYCSAIDVAGNRIFVSADASVFILNYTTPSTLISAFGSFSGCRGIAVDPGSRIFVCDQIGNSVKVYNYTTPSTLLTTLTGFNGPFGIDIDYKNKVIFVTNVSGNTVSILDYTTLSLVGTISATDGNFSSPRFPSVDQYSNRLLIPNAANATISII